MPDTYYIHIGLQRKVGNHTTLWYDSVYLTAILLTNLNVIFGFDDYSLTLLTRYFLESPAVT